MIQSVEDQIDDKSKINQVGDDALLHYVQWLWVWISSIDNSGACCTKKLYEFDG